MEKNRSGHWGETFQWAFLVVISLGVDFSNGGYLQRLSVDACLKTLPNSELENRLATKFCLDIGDTNIDKINATWFSKHLPQPASAHAVVRTPYLIKELTVRFHRRNIKLVQHSGIFPRIHADFEICLPRTCDMVVYAEDSALVLIFQPTTCRTVNALRQRTRC